MGRKSIIFQKTSSIHLAEIKENNVYWYLYDFFSHSIFGFSVTPAIDLSANQGDVLNTNGSFRLSWDILKYSNDSSHSQQGGGYRAGAAMNLENSTTWYRVVLYHLDSSSTCSKGIYPEQDSTSTSTLNESIIVILILAAILGSFTFVTITALMLVKSFVMINTTHDVDDDILDIHRLNLDMHAVEVEGISLNYINVCDNDDRNDMIRSATVIPVPYVDRIDPLQGTDRIDHERYNNNLVMTYYPTNNSEYDSIEEMKVECLHDNNNHNINSYNNSNHEVNIFSCNPTVDRPIRNASVASMVVVNATPHPLQYLEDLESSRGSWQNTAVFRYICNLNSPRNNSENINTRNTNNNIVSNNNNNNNNIAGDIDNDVNLVRNGNIENISNVNATVIPLPIHIAIAMPVDEVDQFAVGGSNSMGNIYDSVERRRAAREVQNMRMNLRLAGFL